MPFGNRPQQPCLNWRMFVISLPFLYFSLMLVQQGNVERRLETIADSPMSDLPCSCVAGSRGLLHCNNAFTGHQSIAYILIHVRVCESGSE